MPKLKTKKGAAKRFKLTGSGRIKRSQSNRRHILTKKAAKRKRKLARPEMVHPSDEARIGRLLGLG